ncbi:hypothetical protein [Tropicibacter naphthalenivorans]|uniref:Uncharacterized protein n=1 Tax=Tropicibacter naphthalenivorans TaxID=441103 RepID=A0A0P1G566_9RHOB|nr:hypothetical protein [Tropicibacter naphthalenivorans]CUH76932.1 hypothetical protein TRN7648_01200 [Tropicibacter naphthalenivorans]SMC62180.1 hypothetical protein SAMN04488093_102418 [Tropicibacter naphthalenivorans]
MSSIFNAAVLMPTAQYAPKPVSPANGARPAQTGPGQTPAGQTAGLVGFTPAAPAATGQVGRASAITPNPAVTAPVSTSQTGVVVASAIAGAASTQGIDVMSAAGQVRQALNPATAIGPQSAEDNKGFAAQMALAGARPGAEPRQPAPEGEGVRAGDRPTVRAGDPGDRSVDRAGDRSGASTRPANDAGEEQALGRFDAARQETARAERTDGLQRQDSARAERAGNADRQEGARFARSEEAQRQGDERTELKGTAARGEAERNAERDEQRIENRAQEDKRLRREEARQQEQPTEVKQREEADYIKTETDFELTTRPVGTSDDATAEDTAVTEAEEAEAEVIAQQEAFEATTTPIGRERPTEAPANPNAPRGGSALTEASSEAPKGMMAEQSDTSPVTEALEAATAGYRGAAETTSAADPAKLMTTA